MLHHCADWHSDRAQRLPAGDPRKIRHLAIEKALRNEANGRGTTEAVIRASKIRAR